MASGNYESNAVTLTSNDGVVFDLSKMVGLDEDFQGLTNHIDIYPYIDPAPLFAAQTFKDKVILLTGASRGIGAEIARQYARVGATLVLIARTQRALDTLKESIIKEAPATKISTFSLDVKDTEGAGRVVKQAVETYGRLDVVVANAGVARPAGDRLGTVDPLEWWNILEVNLRGVFNFVHFALPHLQKTKGSVIAVTSAASHFRQPTYTDYSISKLALDRLIEFIPIEYSEIKSFAVHPGIVDTDGLRGSGLVKSDNVQSFATDSPALPAATILQLSAGKADWLSGRHVSATWDLGEVEKKYKTKIFEKNGLVTKLFIP